MSDELPPGVVKVDAGDWQEIAEAMVLLLAARVVVGPIELNQVSGIVEMMQGTAVCRQFNESPEVRAKAQQVIDAAARTVNHKLEGND